MQKVRLEISGIAYSQTQSGSYVLTLSEAAGNRKLPIVIGGFEAQAIAVELEKMIPNRPLTHDLIKSFCVSFEVVIKEVLIYKFVEGVFYAKLICEKDGVLTEIDSRTSDAIAVGVRFNSPIYTFSNVLDDAGITRDQEDAFENDSLIGQDDTLELEVETSHSSSSMKELEKQLQEALENEDYELASKLRDEIKKRNL
ncbi:MAG: bifunctional nuclease family protein [Crocinitomicaceae bacterium]|jgi:bifunctional DNase/RNase|tara:strand:+ start:27200 stop:27793 length:594 start_codon:yes stop_codon:yes gene_type:complete